MNLTLSTELWPHQEAARQRALNRTHFGLLFEVGTGKTLTALAIYLDKCNAAGRVLPLLILSPKIVCEQWKREIKRFCKALAGHVVVLDGSEKERRAALWAEVHPIGAKRPIVVTNHEALSTMNALLLDLTTFGFQCLIVDESQRHKSPTAKRAKRLRKLATTIKSLRLILTGTPILKGPEDLWSQMNILSPDIFPPNFHSFRAVYYYDENRSLAHKPGHFPDWRPDPSKFPQLKTILDTHCARVKKKDVLTLPPLTRQEVYVELTSEQKKHYAEMERDFITYVRDFACVANIALTKLLRLQQIASGILVTEEEEVRIASGKIAALKELLEDIAPNHKTIVWTCWRATYHDVEKVCAELNLGFTTLTGDTKPNDREESIRRFQNDNDCRVCIANQGAGGVGVNLQAASCMIYLSKTHNLEHDIQSEGRAYRAGSEVHESITRIDIVTKGTIEETVTQALKAKLSFAELLLTFRGGEVERREVA